MPQLQLRLLGNPEITLDDAPIATDRRKAIALLAYLTVTRISHSRDYLATFFWPDADQSRGLAYLRRTLWEINHTVGPEWLDVSRDEVALAAGTSLWLDVAEWDAALASSDAAQWETAVSLYRDDFMAGFSLRDSDAFDTWQSQQVQTRRVELGRLLRQLIDAALAQQAWAAAERHAQRWLAIDPLQEQAHRALMTVWTRLGQRGQALRQYDTCVQLLAAELDVAPEPETEQLAAAIRAGELTAVSPPPPTAAPAPIPTTARRHNLPAAATPFVGRETELAAITAALRDGTARLMTLLGPGGSGKTRLSLAAAQALLPHFADGVWFVPLASLSEKDRLLPAIASALSFRLYDEEQARQQLFDYLRGKSLLLVLDNFEHLLKMDAAALVGDLLAHAPQLRLLVTSRMRLGLRGESLFAVEGMEIPAEATAVSWNTTTTIATAAHTYSALQLFSQSAHLVQPNFMLSPDNIRDVIAICELVQGMPLGIELAASWLGLLTVAEVRAEVQKNLDFLETEMQDVPARQRSIRAVFNYSWQLLTPDEQTVFPQLAIFHGGLTRQAATAVAGATPAILMALVNKSLIRREENGRFAIHELLRQYAAEKIQADPEAWLAARQRHADHYLGWLADQSTLLKGPQQKTAFDTLEDDIDNIRAAWLWAVMHQQYQTALAGVDSLFIYYLVRGSLEELGGLLDVVLEDVRAQATDQPITRGTFTLPQQFFINLLAVQAIAATTRMVSPEAEQYSREAIALMNEAGVIPELALPYILASNTYAWHVNLEQGIEYSEAALKLLRQQHNRWYLALMTHMVGGLLWHVRRREEAAALLQEGAAISREIGDDLLLSYNLTMLSTLQADEKAYDQALAYQEEIRDIYMRLQSPLGVARALVSMGTICDAAGWYQKGLDFYNEACQIFDEIGGRLSMAEALSWVSITQQRLGHYAQAMHTRKQALRHFEEAQDINGRGWSFFEMGELYRVLDDLPLANKYYQKSHAIFADHDMKVGLAFSFRGQAYVAILNGQLAAAEEMLAQSLHHGEVSYDDWGLTYTHFVKGLLHLARSNLAAAHSAFTTSLALGKNVSNQGVVMQTLLGFALLAQQAGEETQAARVAQTIVNFDASWAETRTAAQEIISTVSPTTQAATAVTQSALDELIDSLLATDNMPY